jgi:hypothetical protein
MQIRGRRYAGAWNAPSAIGQAADQDGQAQTCHAADGGETRTVRGGSRLIFSDTGIGSLQLAALIMTCSLLWRRACRSRVTNDRRGQGAPASTVVPQRVLPTGFGRRHRGNRPSWRTARTGTRPCRQAPRDYAGSSQPRAEQGGRERGATARVSGYGTAPHSATVPSLSGVIRI